MDFKELESKEYDITLLESQLNSILDCIEFFIHEVYGIDNFYNLSKDEKLKKDILQDLWKLLNSYKREDKIKNTKNNFKKFA